MVHGRRHSQTKAARGDSSQCQYLTHFAGSYMRTRINISLVLLLVNTEQKQFCFVMPRGPFFSRLFFLRKARPSLNRLCPDGKHFLSNVPFFLFTRSFFSFFLCQTIRHLLVRLVRTNRLFLVSIKVLPTSIGSGDEMVGGVRCLEQSAIAQATTVHWSYCKGCHTNTSHHRKRSSERSCRQIC